jgi:hypothetical protein
MSSRTFNPASNPGNPMFSCIFPCLAKFDSEQKLAQHYQNRKKCKKHWKERHTAIAREAYERILRGDPAPVPAFASLIDLRSGSALPTTWGDSGKLPTVQHIDTPTGMSPTDTPPADTPPTDMPPIETSTIETPPINGPPSDSPIALPQEDGMNLVEPTSLDVLPALVDLHLGEEVEDVTSEGEILDGDADNLSESAGENFEEWLFDETNENPSNDHPSHDDSQSEEGSTDDPQPESSESAPIDIDNGPPLQSDLNVQQPDEDPSVIENFERAGEIQSYDIPRYVELLEIQERSGNGNMYFPFEDYSEFELAAWLNDLPLRKIDTFLQTRFVSGVHSIY